MASEPPSPGVDHEAVFKPYRSILNFSSSSTRGANEDEDEDAGQQPLGATDRHLLPPWRRAVGSAFFSLEHDHFAGETVPGYAELLERTFAGFSDEVIGADVAIVDFRTVDHDTSWDIDEDPEVAHVNGGGPVLYEVANDVTAPPVDPNAPTPRT